MPNETIHVFDQFQITVEPGVMQVPVMNGDGPKLDPMGEVIMKDEKLIYFNFTLDDRRELYRYVMTDDKREALISILTNDMTAARKKKVAALLTPTARKTKPKAR